MKSLRMATFKGRPWRADRAANGLSLCWFAASPRPEKADLGDETGESECETRCAAATEVGR